MTIFNDPTSCNDLKITLISLALLTIGAFIWLYDRGNQAISLTQEHQVTNENLKLSSEQQHIKIQSLREDLLKLNDKNKLLIVKNASASEAIAISKQRLQQTEQNFVIEKQNLNIDIASLKNKQTENQATIDQFIKQQTDSGLKLEVTEQNLNESRQLSEQQFNEFKQLRRDHVQVKFDADTRLKAIKEWEQEVVQLKEQLANSKIKIIESKQRFTVFEMEQDILFGQGQYQLKDEGHQVLAKLATILRQFPDRQIAIQGHSDAQKLGEKLKQKYSSNWELAAARAASAIHYLQGSEAIKPERIILVSFAHYRPKNSGASDQSLAENRRIEITLMPKDFSLLGETSH